MALSNYWISGTSPGSAVTIRGITYPANFWSWSMTSGHIELNTVSSVPFTDTQTGNKKLVFKARGTANYSANPFNPVFAPVPPYLNTYQLVSVVAYSSGANPATKASGYVLISGWDYEDTADGQCTWELTAYGAWQFTNLFNTYL